MPYSNQRCHTIRMTSPNTLPDTTNEEIIHPASLKPQSSPTLEHKLAQKEDKDHTWVWRSFGIATPWAFGRYVHSSDIKLNEDELQIEYSVPTITMYRALHQYIWGFDDISAKINAFSTESLKKMIMSKAEEDESLHDVISNYNTILVTEGKQESETLKTERQILIEIIIRVIGSEMSDVYPVSHYPIINLVTGVLYDKNWLMLSPDDMKKWALSYGAVDEDGDVFLPHIIRQQNSMFREIGENDDLEVRGRETVLEFIQPQYEKKEFGGTESDKNKSDMMSSMQLAALGSMPAMQVPAGGQVVAGMSVLPLSVANVTESEALI